MFGAKSERSTQTMSNIDQLISYILTLTPEQVEKAISLLPQVTEALAEQQQPAPQLENVQNQ